MVRAAHLAEGSINPQHLSSELHRNMKFYQKIARLLANVLYDPCYMNHQLSSDDAQNCLAVISNLVLSKGFPYPLHKILPCNINV